MTRYISNPDNLKLMMNMLKEKSRNIQFEAFHVFKVLSYQKIINEKELIQLFYNSNKSIFIFIYSDNRCLSLIQINRNQYWTYYFVIKKNWLNFWHASIPIDQKTNNSMMKKHIWLSRSKNWSLYMKINALSLLFLLKLLLLIFK